MPAVDGSEWLPEAAVKPLQYGPIKVKVAVQFHYIRIAENQAQAFATRFALHLEWFDPYYMLKEQPENPKDIIHYSTHPGVGRPSRNFPPRAESIRGVEIDTNGLPRWTPEISFCDTEHHPTIIREEYSADRHTGIVTCYLEGTGNFAHDHEISRNEQKLKWSICSHHRTHTLEFEQHHKISRVGKSPFSEWSFEDKPIVADFTEEHEGPGSTINWKYRKVSFTISAKRNLQPVYLRGPMQAFSYVYSELKGPLVLTIGGALWHIFMRRKGVCETPDSRPVVEDVLGFIGWCEQE